MSNNLPFMKFQIFEKKLNNFFIVKKVKDNKKKRYQLSIYGNEKKRK